MSASIEVPASVVARARRHFTKTGCPLLLRDRRRRNDWELVAIPANRGYLLVMGPATLPAQWYVAMSEQYPQRDLLADLCRVVVAGIEGLPQRFTCEGKVVGMWEIVSDDAANSACVRGPVALTCLSWLLREQRVGFYLRLSVLDTD